VLRPLTLPALACPVLLLWVASPAAAGAVDGTAQAPLRRSLCRGSFTKCALLQGTGVMPLSARSFCCLLFTGCVALVVAFVPAADRPVPRGPAWLSGRSCRAGWTVLLLSQQALLCGYELQRVQENRGHVRAQSPAATSASYAELYTRGQGAVSLQCAHIANRNAW